MRQVYLVSKTEHHTATAWRRLAGHGGREHAMLVEEDLLAGRDQQPKSLEDPLDGGNGLCDFDGLRLHPSIVEVLKPVWDNCYLRPLYLTWLMLSFS